MDSQDSERLGKHVEERVRRPGLLSGLSRPSGTARKESMSSTAPLLHRPISQTPSSDATERPEEKSEERAKQSFLDRCENWGRTRRERGGEERSHFNTVEEIRELNKRYPRDGAASAKSFPLPAERKWERVRRKFLKKGKSDGK
jgi:hypothetical protein